MFSSTHFDIRLSLQRSQVYKKPSNWNGEQFNAKQKKVIAWKSAFNKKLLAARLKSYEIHLPDNSAPHKPLPIKNQFFEENKKQNPYISAKGRWQGDLKLWMYITSHLGWGQIILTPSTLGTSSWRGTIDHPQRGTQVTTAFGQDLGVASDKQWWHWMKRKCSDILGIWCIICVWDVDWWKWCQQWMMNVSNLLML